MTEQQIKSKLRQIIADMGGVAEVDLSKKLTEYIRKSSKRILAARIDVQFEVVNGTILYNDLFSEIKTGEDIVEFIQEYYPEQNSNNNE